MTNKECTATIFGRPLTGSLDADALRVHLSDDQLDDCDACNAYRARRLASKKHVARALHKSRFDRIADIAGASLPTEHDAWGETMGLFFSVAEVLHMTAEVVMESDGYHDHALEALARWDYSPSPYASVPDIETVAARADDYSEGEFSGDYPYETIALAVAYRDGDVTQDDLIYAGDVLSRYSDMLRRAGKDY